MIYIGTYSRRESRQTGSKGIYALSDGSFEPRLAAEIDCPRFLAIHPNRRFLYSVSEVDAGTVTAFRIDHSTGMLERLNTVSTGGSEPCHLSIDPSGRTIVVANYGDGSVCSIAVREDGRLDEASPIMVHGGSSVHPLRQASAHAHAAVISNDGQFVVVPDLGLDQVLVYRLDASRAMLEPHNPPFAKVEPGSGPRHFAFHPNGRLGYLINELSSTITVFSWNAGALRDLQTISTLPPDHSGENYTAEIAVHPGGTFLYGSNRGRDSIVAFSIDPAGGLSKIEEVSSGGRTPRHFAISRNGNSLYAGNEDSDSVVIFDLDIRTGRLRRKQEIPGIPTPACIRLH